MTTRNGAAASAGTRSVQAPALTAIPLLCLALLGAGCAGRASPQTAGLSACEGGTMQLVIVNDRPMKIRVLEQSQLDITKVLGELPGRGRETFDIPNRAGMYYSVVVPETGELIAAENSHPRGFISKGASITRHCESS